MLTTRLTIRRTAPLLNRGGFTLVELLVVIGIIAILAGVALGPITNGIKKAKQSSGVQSSHAIGLAMYSAANDNSQLYPDGTSDASDVAKILLSGGYVTDSGIFFISGDTASGATKYTGTAAATGIAQANVSWDFLSNGGTGASSATYTSLPLLWSTANGGTPPTSAMFQAGIGNAITAVVIPANPFQTDGMVVFYVNNSAAFVKSTLATTTYTVTMLSTSNNSTGGGPAYKVLSGL